MPFIFAGNIVNRFVAAINGHQHSIQWNSVSCGGKPRYDEITSGKLSTVVDVQQITADPQKVRKKAKRRVTAPRYGQYTELGRNKYYLESPECI